MEGCNMRDMKEIVGRIRYLEGVRLQYHVQKAKAEAINSVTKRLDELYWVLGLKHGEE